MPPSSPPSSAEPPALARVAFGGCCPRCGGGPLFSGMLRFAPRCTKCGLDYGRFNVGDGAAAFLIFIVGGIVMVAALVVDARYGLAWWVHALLWVPVTILLTVALQRIAKALLVALEWRNNAGEGRG